MGEIAVTILKMTARFVFIMAALVAFVIMLNIVTSMVFVGVNMGAFTDVTAMVSMWLPFDLPILMWWLLTAATAYIGYRIALTSMIWLNRFIGA